MDEVELLTGINQKLQTVTQAVYGIESGMDNMNGSMLGTESVIRFVAYLVCVVLAIIVAKWVWKRLIMGTVRSYIKFPF